MLMVVEELEVLGLFLVFLVGILFFGLVGDDGGRVGGGGGGCGGCCFEFRLGGWFLLLLFWLFLVLGRM